MVVMPGNPLDPASGTRWNRGVRIATTVHHARLGRDVYRVIRPATPIARVMVRDNQDWWFVAADPAGAMRVAGLIEIAARSPRSLVHIPLRGDGAPVGWQWLKQAGAVDLLVVQPRLQFPAHRWSDVRRRLDSGRMQSFEVAGRTREQVCDESPGCWRRTVLAKPAITRAHAGTLLVTASPPALRAFADCFAHLASCGPGSVGRGAPYFREKIHPLDGLFRREERGWFLVHCDSWSAGGS